MTSVNIHPIFDSCELTMTSLEVAELTGKRHDHVVEKIKELSAKAIIRGLPEIREKYESTKKGGRPINLYRLNRTESINLVANLCPEFTARIVKRWMELERQQSGQSYYDQLQTLSLNIKLSEQLGRIGSGLMNHRKEEKRLLKMMEEQLAMHCQLTI